MSPLDRAGRFGISFIWSEAATARWRQWNGRERQVFQRSLLRSIQQWLECENAISETAPKNF
jgi:hypothetical protein